MLVVHSEWHTYKGEVGSEGQVNRTPGVLVSGGSGTEWRVMAQQGSISSL